MHSVRFRAHASILSLLIAASLAHDVHAQAAPDPAPSPSTAQEQTPGQVRGPGAPSSPVGAGGLQSPGAVPGTPIDPSAVPSPVAPAAPAVPAAEPQEAQPAEASEPSPDQVPATQQEVGFVQEDLNGVRTDLENFKFQWQRERDLHTAITTRYLVINGVVQARAGWQDTAVESPTVYKRKTSFDIPTALLAFNGSLYRDYEEGKNLNYSVRFGVSQQTNTNNSFLNLLDAFITYNVLPTISPEKPQLAFTVGQQLLPFGLEVPATEELKPVIRNAQFTTALGLARRDIGLFVRGDLFPLVDFGYNYRVPVLAYTLGVINGSGPNTLDDNNAKDIVARVAFTVPTEFNSWLRQFTIGGTAYLGKQNVYHTDSTSTPPKATLLGTGRKRRYGGDIYYNHWPFGLTYEFIAGEDEVATGATPDTAVRSVIHSQAHTGTGFLSFGEQFVAGFRNQGRFDDWWPKTFQPFVRYDRWDPNTKVKRNEVEVYTGGLNIFFAETTKFQVNYNAKKTKALSDPWAHEVLAQAQFGF